MTVSLSLNVQLAGACGHIEAKWRVVEVKVLARHCGVSLYGFDALPDWTEECIHDRPTGARAD